MDNREPAAGPLETPVDLAPAGAPLERAKVGNPGPAFNASCPAFKNGATASNNSNPNMAPFTIYNL